MLSRDELGEIRAKAEHPTAGRRYNSEALETIHVLLWHIDALESRQGAP